jgi:uncharacterized protein YutE (UPF0331/DUF86 family)
MSRVTEREVLAQMVPELEADGYEVYLEPSKGLSPAFLGNFRPDAIALRGDKNFVIEVLSTKNPSAAEKIAKLQGLLLGQDGWELKLVWIEEATKYTQLYVQTNEKIKARIAETKILAERGNLEPALLLGWGTFEAIARATFPQQFERPQTPRRIIEILANQGNLTPTEADALRILAEKRNKLIHGDLNQIASKIELDMFISVLVMLTDQLPN